MRSGVFQSTQWSDINRADTRHEGRRQAVIDALTNVYWKPVFVYLKWRGYGDEEALDLTQGFFQEVVLERCLFQQADKAKGRFRSFLLASLNHYVSSHHRKENTRKRGGLQRMASAEVSGLCDRVPTDVGNPEKVFQYVWAAELLDRVLSEVRREYESTDRALYWRVFELRVLQPIIASRRAPSLTEVCAECDIEDQKKASNMIVTVKRRFRVVLLRFLGETLQSEDNSEEELCDLISVLSGRRAV